MSCDFRRGTLWLNKDYDWNVKEQYQAENCYVSACSQSAYPQIDFNLAEESIRDNIIIWCTSLQIEAAYCTSPFWEKC